MRRFLAVLVVLPLVGLGALSEAEATASGSLGQPTESSASEGAERVEQIHAAREALEGFDDTARQALEDFNIPGAALAVVAGGELVHSEGYGFRDLEAQRPMTADTLFAIGSTTKAMTATLLGILVDEGHLDWDQPLRRYLPAFRMADPTVSERLTPRDLITHRSGLPRHDLLWYNNDKNTRAELVERLAYLELSADLRQRYQYNNLMFMTAGYLAGQLTGRTWEQALQGRLFAPLGMGRSNFSVAESQMDDDFAQPYRENDEQQLERIPFRNIDLIGPAGSVNSSVNEMARWLLFNLNGGRVGERQLVEPATLDDIHSPHMTTGATPDRPEISQGTYGLGWVITTYRGHRRVAHGGGIDGFSTSVVLFPDDGVGLVAFTNRGSGLPSLLNRHVADRLLGLDPIDWLGEALDKREKALAERKQAEERKQATRVVGTRPSHPLGDYAGSYDHAGYGSLEIVAAGETGLEIIFNGIVAPLEHWHYDVWNGAETEGDPTFENQKLLFRGDLDGNIAAVEAILEPRVAPIVLQKRPDPRLSDPKHLSRFEGTYEAATGTRVTVAMSGSVLTVSVPGQPTSTLEPDLSGRFALKELRIVRLEFVTDADGRVTKVLLHQPGGVFEAVRVP
jgi:CubicO group peptidase (beta-lactamase class C family)